MKNIAKGKGTFRGTTTAPIELNEDAADLFPNGIIPPGTSVIAKFDAGRTIGRASVSVRDEWTNFDIRRGEFAIA